MARWSQDVGNAITTNLFFDEPTNACWFATQDGRVRTFTVLHQTLRTLGSGWPDAIAVLPSIDGLTFFVVVSSGDMFVASRTRGDRGAANRIAMVSGSLVAASRLANDDLLVLDSSGQINRVTPASGSVAAFATLAGASGLTVDDAADELLVALSAATSDVRRLALDDGSEVGTPLSVATPIAAIVVSPGGSGAVVVDDDGNVTAIDGTGVADPYTFSAPGLTAICRWHSLLIAAVGSWLELVEWGDDVQTLPLTVGLDPLVPGGWAPLEVDYAAAGLTQDDVAWSVDKGPTAGMVSVARPSEQAQSKYEHRVIAGWSEREFRVVATQRSNSTLIGTRRLRVVSVWPDTEVGPPMAVTGPQRVYAKPGGWGGGPAGPQNINLTPAKEEMRIAVAVFRVNGATSSVNGGHRVTQLKEDVNGSGRSVKTYYEEVSFRSTPASANPSHPRGTTVTLLGNQVFGPIDLDYSWGDLFEHPHPADRWAAWEPKGGTWDLLGGAFSWFLLDSGLSGAVTMMADSFIFSVLPGTDDPYVVGDKEWPAHWTWAFAGDSQVYWGDQLSARLARRASVIMPAALPANHPFPWPAGDFMTTICHELGHNLGCPDLYDPAGVYPAEMNARLVTGWDLMSSDSPLPHFALAHRMRLGWVSPDWIEVCDFGANPASRTVTLQSIETVTRSGPPAGRKAGIEVRIWEGWNYYFEYRRKQTGTSPLVGDRELPVPNAVLGTDVFQAGADDIQRALILLLPDDVDGDGSKLRGFNDDYEESDVTNADRMNDFRLTRKGHPPLDNDAINVEIEYVGAHRAELQITPAPGKGNFKSPDIIVDGPAGPNIAVKGKTNTIKVHVHNRGTKAADAVRIHVQWLPFTSAPGPWNQLPDPPTQPISAHSTREFTVSWPLAASVPVNGTEAEHFCVRVDVDRYVDPINASGSEIVVHNNWAQSNFSADATRHGSPSERRSTAVTATNVLPMRAMHRTLIEQSSEHFRTFVDHAWRRLAPGQSDVTRLSYESLAGDPLHDRDFQIAFREARDRGLTTDLTARSFLRPERRSDGTIERWGVQLLVRAGLRTVIDRLGARGELVSGEVRAGDDGAPQVVNSGNIRLVGWPDRQPDQQSSSDGQVENDGTFRVKVPSELMRLSTRERVIVMVYYHGTARFTPCHSRVVPLERG